MLWLFIMPLANAAWETKDASERYGVGAGICAALGGLVGSRLADSDSRLEGASLGALAGGLLGAAAVTGASF
jgi:outer membrane lipoprotein SlyB